MKASFGTKNMLAKGHSTALALGQCQRVCTALRSLAPPARAGVRLGIGHDLTRIALDPKHPRKISTEAELLALRPELKQTE